MPHLALGALVELLSLSASARLTRHRLVNGFGAPRGLPDVVALSAFLAVHLGDTFSAIGLHWPSRLRRAAVKASDRARPAAEWRRPRLHRSDPRRQVLDLAAWCRPLGHSFFGGGAARAVKSGPTMPRLAMSSAFSGAVAAEAVSELCEAAPPNSSDLGRIDLAHVRAPLPPRSAPGGCAAV